MWHRVPMVMTSAQQEGEESFDPATSFRPVDTSEVSLPTENPYVNEIIHFASCCEDGGGAGQWGSGQSGDDEDRVWDLRVGGDGAAGGFGHALMRELAILSFVTLDGVMQSPTSPEEDPSGGFTAGGWGAPYWEQVMPQVYAEAMSEPYDLLFGRKTYDVFASHWPGLGDSDPVAARLNGGRKYVVTRSAEHPLPWKESTRISGDIPAERSRG